MMMTTREVRGKRGDGVGGARKVCAATNYSTVVRVSESYVHSYGGVRREVENRCESVDDGLGPGAAVKGLGGWVGGAARTRQRGVIMGLNRA
ncbi:unnamed protein product [Macrosiphum euphorbiae]|uniref:Uncharacterized protein n=1 Tax=Macrosiphum euphorbiae TaxID=13131 RepID=A0AAV0XLU9_9HEMI|nr:unnamed protein product [Macrosiphum euphorbiae]